VKCLRDSDRGEAIAVPEGTIPNATDILWDSNRGQSGARNNGVIPDTSETLWNDERAQARGSAYQFTGLLTLNRTKSN